VREEQSDGEQGPVRVGLRQALGVLTFVHVLDRSQLDEHRPIAHRSTKRSSQLADLALELAKQGREDTDAVHKLSDAAGRHRRELRRAAAGIRFMGWTEDSIEHDRANRLLLAAARKQPVEPLTAEKIERLQTLKSLQEGSLDTGYEFLAKMQPTLRLLDRDVRDAAGQESGTSVEVRRGRLWDTFGDRLHSLLGPEAQHAPDPILRTLTALLLADRYLNVAFGLPDPTAAGDDT
jgi:hypothetical protein